MNFLKSHRFGIEAYFENTLVLTLAVPKNELTALIPERLDLDIYDEKWAFLAIAMVQTKDLRIKGLPRFLGRDFFLVGYRIFVKYKTKTGKRMRGLYILKSETDQKSMEFFGNLMTHYTYQKVDINQVQNGHFFTINSKESSFRVCFNRAGEELSIPKGSPFSDWKTARRFSGPLPFTFSVNESEKTVLIVEGVRSNWKPEPVSVEEYHFDFLKESGIKNWSLASAFEIKNVPYSWKKGKIESWK